MASNQYFPVLPQSPMFPGQGTATMPQSQTPWGSQPWLTSPTDNPYQVPTQSGQMPSSAGQRWDPSKYGASMESSSGNLGHGIIATGLQFPGLSQDFANYLLTQIGQGVQPYNLSTPLPFGGQTMPGQLTANANPLLQQLMQYYQTGQGGGMPGADALSTIATKGIDALPEWQKMIAAQQQNIGQNEAQLREQFAGMGGLAGSPFGTAMSNYMQQTTLDQNALLAQLQQQNILQGQMPAAEFLQTGANQFGQFAQGMDQQAIQNMLQEFIRTSPQNNPLLQYIMGMSTLYPPTNKTPTTSQTAMQWVGTMGDVAQNIMRGIGAMCPAEGSLILMSDGTEKPVEDSVPGDEVMGIDDEPCVVEDVPRCVEKTIRVVFNNGFVACNSLSHAYALPRGGFTVASKSLGKTVLTRLGPAKVVAVEPAGEHFVFNILTDGSHTYRASGVWALGVGDAERSELMLMADMLVP